jgi:hypothetical protein
MWGGTAVLAAVVLSTTAATTTQCAGPQSGAKKATGSVVRCKNALSCDVVLRRATTKLYADRLDNKVVRGVVAAGAAEAACLLLTHRLSTHVICAVGGTYLSSRLIDRLRKAGAAGDCLKVHFQAPGQNGTLKPLAFSSDGGGDCAD